LCQGGFTLNAAIADSSGTAESGWSVYFSHDLTSGRVQCWQING